MIRVLQLISSDADFQTRRAVSHLGQDLGASFQVETRAVGEGGDWHNALAAVIGLRRLEPFDLVHAWGGKSLLVASVAAPGRIVFSPSPYLGRRTTGWLRAVSGYRDVHAILPTATMRRLCVERGVPIGRCHLIRPGVDFSRVRRRRDPGLRAALGFGPNDTVVLAAGESTRAAEHDLAVWAGSILHTVEPRYRLLLWGRGSMAGSAARLASQFDQQNLLSLAEQRLGRAVEFEELLPAADLVLVTAVGQVPTLPIAICMAAGLPIVSTVTYTVAELLEDRHTALMVPKPHPKLLTQRVIDLMNDPGLQWTISDAARTEAYEYFALTRFLNQYRTVYRQAAEGEKVEVPLQAPGAGLRFSGRV